MRRPPDRMPGTAARMETRVAGCLVEAEKGNGWIVHHAGGRYRLILQTDEIGTKGYDIALFEAVEALKAGERGARL